MIPPATSEELLAQMVSFDTVNPRFGGPVGGESALARYLETLALGWGLRTQHYGLGRLGSIYANYGSADSNSLLSVTRDSEANFNLLVTCEADPGGEWLLFESHLDTVGIEGMTIEPFAGRVEGGRIYGRGVCDTKGSGAAALWALRNYARAAVRPRNIGLLFAFDEEAQMTGARAYALQELPKLLPNLRGVIVGEPTLLRPVVAHNGLVRWRTITRGIAAHSANPAKGQSAISSMVRVVEALETRFVPHASRRHLLTGGAAASINTIRGGTAVNVIPALCEIECDRRTAPGETVGQILRERDAALVGLAVEHDSLYVVPPLVGDLSGGFHSWLGPIIAQYGIDPSPYGAPYVTDASHFAEAGAPTLVLGPGDFAQAHTNDEWLARDQLALAVEVYSGLMSAATAPAIIAH